MNEAVFTRAQARIRQVQPGTVASSLHRYFVIDVREPQEVLDGFLPGALNVPRGVIEHRIIADSRFHDKEQPILVYSRDGKRSALAALTLRELGFTDVQSLAGGYSRWSDQHLPVV